MDAITRALIAAYYQEPQVTQFFSGFFTSKQGNFHNSERVAIDIVRSDEDVSIVLQDLTTGYRYNAEDLYTNKEMKPPIHKEAFPINAFDLIKRAAGQNPFGDYEFRANLMTRFMEGMRKVERKVRRAIELQASQVLQTGMVNLTDTNGVALYTLNYMPKSTHFPTAGTSWATATGAQMLSDLESLAAVIRTDGLSRPDQLIFGNSAWNKFIGNADIQKLFDLRRYDMGTISPIEMRGQGAIYRGTIDIGAYKFDIWTYDATYKNPNGGASTPYLAPGKVIVRSSEGRMDASFGNIPNFNSILGVGERLIPELPSRFNSTGTGMDLFTNVWKTADGEQLFGGVGSRPLMIPVAIDTFGCLTTQLT